MSMWYITWHHVLQWWHHMIVWYNDDITWHHVIQWWHHMIVWYMMTSHDIMWYNDDITWNHVIQWWHHMIIWYNDDITWSCDTMMTSHDCMIQWWHHMTSCDTMMTSHGIMIEDHSQDWWDRATKCFLNLQESVVQRSGQNRHSVRAGGERSGRRGPLITRHQPMNSTCTSTKRTQWLYYILSAYCFELGRARPCTYPVFTGIKSYPVVREHFHYRIAARWGWEGGRKGREKFSQANCA